MALIPLLLWCFLPPALWAAYCAIAFRYSPLRSLCGSLLALAAVALAVALRLSFDHFGFRFSGVARVIYSSVIGAALTEEVAKLAATRVLAGNLLNHATPRGDASPRVDPSAGPVCGADRLLLAGAVLVGLSFSAFETVFFALGNPSSIWLRTLTALPVHAAAALVGGSVFLGAARESSGGANFGFLLLAIILHGAYSACMETGGTLIFGGLLAALVLVFIAAGIWNGTDSAAERNGA